MSIDWKRKLTSRKFWLAVTGLVAGIILAFNGGQELANTVSGVIMAAASVIAYAIGEGLADSASASSATYVLDSSEVFDDYEDEDEEDDTAEFEELAKLNGSEDKE